MSERYRFSPSYLPSGFDHRLFREVTCLTEPFFEYWADVLTTGLGLFTFDHHVRIGHHWPDYRELDPRIPGCYRHRYRQIVLNEAYFDRHPQDVLAVLTHCLCHCHFRTYGRGLRHAHGPHFLKKMSGLGILCEDDGRHYGVVEGPFLRLLREYGIPT
jgi:hypothetical protein